MRVAACRSWPIGGLQDPLEQTGRAVEVEVCALEQAGRAVEVAACASWPMGGLQDPLEQAEPASAVGWPVSVGGLQDPLEQTGRAVDVAVCGLEQA